MKFNIAFLLILSYVSFGQTGHSKIKLEVLKKNIIGKEFVFGKWNETGEEEYDLTYLGSVKTKNGKVYKILNSVWSWGKTSIHTTNRIFVFNSQNQYLGGYSISTPSYLPTELKNGYLIFRNSNEDCDKKIATKINFNNGIPKHFFRKCDNKYGDWCDFGEGN